SLPTHLSRAEAREFLLSLPDNGLGGPEAADEVLAHPGGIIARLANGRLVILCRTEDGYDVEFAPITAVAAGQLPFKQPSLGVDSDATGDYVVEKPSREERDNAAYNMVRSARPDRPRYIEKYAAGFRQANCAVCGKQFSTSDATRTRCSDHAGTTR